MQTNAPWSRVLTVAVLAVAVGLGVVAAHRWLKAPPPPPEFRSAALYTEPRALPNVALATAGGRQGPATTLLQGRWRLVFFGFTHCPDVCPTALFDMSEVLKRLPADKRVSALFVTVDPERDTPAILKDYLSSFDPRISGLSGTRPEIDAALKSYRVYSKKQPQENGDYSMDHSAIIYLMDKQGRFVTALNLQSPPEAVAKEIQRFM